MIDSIKGFPSIQETTEFIFPLSIFSYQLLVDLPRVRAVESNVIKPNCSLPNNLFEVKYSCTCPYKIFSKTLATVGKTEIGR